MKEETISVVKACGLLGIATSTLYKWKDKGLIHVIPPQQAAVRVADIERILAEREGKIDATIRIQERL